MADTQVLGSEDRAGGEVLGDQYAGITVEPDLRRGLVRRVGGRPPGASRPDGPRFQGAVA